MTTHSLAYQATVKPYKLKLGEFNTRSITEYLSYEEKADIVSTIREFCLSSFTSLQEFSQYKELSPQLFALCQKYLDLMATSKIECTHDFYLKLFHIHLASGDITYKPFDFIMIDEYGDINPVTLEIFKLLPSSRKIAVGDPLQNIYTFNHTINGFIALASEGTMFNMSQSFRVSAAIAPRIEFFCRRYLDPQLDFKGTICASTNITTSAYIARTNSALIAKMIELNRTGIPYGLVRKATEIFKMPLMLLAIKHKGFISDPAYKHLQNDVNSWHEQPHLRTTYKSVFAYLMYLYPEDFQLVQAIRLIGRFGKTAIMEAYLETRKHEHSDQSLLLMTAHSSKGLEVDEVTLADDMNMSIQKIVSKITEGFPIELLTETELESLRLYYVACSRCSVKLNNAVYLDRVDIVEYPELFL